MQLKRVVITGLGAVTPLGLDVQSTWRSVLEGCSGAGPITLFDSTLFATRFACEVRDFDPSFCLDSKEQRRIDRCTQLAYVAALEAWEDAHLPDSIDKERIGVIIGSGIGGIGTLYEQIHAYGRQENDTPHFSPFLIPKSIIDMSAGYIAIRLGLKGPNFATAAACAASSVAIMTAMNHIRLGKADAILTGGCEAEITPVSIGGFNAMRALSTDNEHMLTASRPFSKSRSGFVAGEGAAVLLLEEYEHATARGANIYAEIVGYGSTADAFHMTAPDPAGQGAARVMKEAIEDAGIRPEDVDYINAHGTSTTLGDVAEVKAILQVFGEHAFKMNISSTKSMTGHQLGASGAIEAMLTTLALQEGIVPPTINHMDGDDDPEFDPRLNFTFNKAQKRAMTYALSNSFGFGGHNASLLFKRYTN